MPTVKDGLQEELLETDDEFRRLFEQHRSCEGRLSQITLNPLPSEQDELEAKQLKLHKLFLRDRMEEIIRHHRETRAQAPA